jgi:hypothetical protein
MIDPLTDEQKAFLAQFNVDPALKNLQSWASFHLQGGKSIDEVKDQIKRAMLVVQPAREAGNILIFAPRELKLEQITNAVVGVFEGPYSPWIHSVEAKTPYESNGTIWYAREDYWRDGGKMRLTYDDPDHGEGNGKGRAEVGLEEMISGLEKMAIHAPQHFNDLVEENDDAITHDVFMQYVILGDIIYG